MNHAVVDILTQKAVYFSLNDRIIILNIKMEKENSKNKGKTNAEF